jgi:hypothetical protein
VQSSDQTWPPEIRFHPWLGDGYESSVLRLLVLGESHYANPNGEVPDLTSHTICAYLNWHKTGKARRPAFFTRVQQVVEGNRGRPNEEARKRFWNEIAFFNYCEHLVGAGARKRPDRANWGSGALALQSVLERLRPTRVLVCGHELWDNVRGANASDSKWDIEEDWARVTNANGMEILVGSITHPSAPKFSAPKSHAHVREVWGSPSENRIWTHAGRNSVSGVDSDQEFNRDGSCR